MFLQWLHYSIACQNPSWERRHKRKPAVLLVVFLRQPCCRATWKHMRQPTGNISQILRADEMNDWMMYSWRFARRRTWRKGSCAWKHLFTYVRHFSCSSITLWTNFCPFLPASWAWLTRPIASVCTCFWTTNTSGVRLREISTVKIDGITDRRTVYLFEYISEQILYVRPYRSLRERLEHPRQFLHLNKIAKIPSEISQEGWLRYERVKVNRTEIDGHVFISEQREDCWLLLFDVVFGVYWQKLVFSYLYKA